MTLLSLIFFTCLLLYGALLLLIYIKSKTTAVELIAELCPIRLSIIIPARNEVNHIVSCIRSVLDNDYPVGDYEIIVVNDHSEDGTLDVLNQFRDEIIILNAVGIGKKKAIEQGVKQARFDNIITLDADCMVNKHWLKCWSHHIFHEKPTVATGIVKISQPRSVIAHYEALDVLNLMAVTKFGIAVKCFVLGNGANLFFKKDFYLHAKPFVQYASGDDVFLLNQANNQGHKVSFNNHSSSSVSTNEQSSFSQLLNQRKRWATKTKGYANTSLILLQSLVFCTNFVALVSVFSLILFPFQTLSSIATVFLFAKFIIEYLYLSALSRVLGVGFRSWHFIPSYFINIGVYLYMAFYAMFPAKYQWKNRTVN